MKNEFGIKTIYSRKDANSQSGKLQNIIPNRNLVIS